MKLVPYLFLVAILCVGCLESPSSSDTGAADLLDEPELAGESATDEAFIVDGTPFFTMAVGAVAKRVHITTWPYNTTWITHVKATSDYVDGGGETWYHLDFWPVKTKYVTNPLSEEEYLASRDSPPPST